MKKEVEAAPEKRIYCIVASTVQIAPTSWGEGKTLSVVQPLGRQGAQIGHAVSKARCAMLRAMLLKAVLRVVKGRPSATLEVIKAMVFQPITTITLEARDSAELQHVFGLLQKNGTPVHQFLDTEQSDYGDVNAHVRTAIATEPVTRESMVGILDYLPLWGSQYEIKRVR